MRTLRPPMPEPNVAPLPQPLRLTRVVVKSTTVALLVLATAIVIYVVS